VLTILAVLAVHLIWSWLRHAGELAEVVPAQSGERDAW
jgi:hypothetical protein